MPGLRSSRRLPALAAALCAACSGDLQPGAPDGDADAADLTSGFGGGFHPSDAPWGGFGGGSCQARRTPVVFLHGNASESSTWNKKASWGGPSVLAALRAAGWNACELFALNWLSPAERAAQERNFHTPAQAARVRTFLADVRRYTGAAQVDLVGHSMGVTVGLHALEPAGAEAGVRSFVAIAGGLRGLASCLSVGPANPLFPTCGSQSLVDPDVFGFYPLANWRMAAGGFRDRPVGSAVAWSSIRAGQSDEYLCPSCDSALFTSSRSVRAQLDVGRGHPVTTGTDDSEGVGHFRARSDAGPLLVNLLGSDCSGAACCAGVPGVCRE